MSAPNDPGPSGAGPTPPSAGGSSSEQQKSEISVASNVNEMGNGGGSGGMTAEQKNLNVRDALSFLDAVKSTFTHAPEVYNRFLDIMKDFKTHSIDTPGVIDRVSALFKDHSSLIQGFNTFLPPGYQIEFQSPSDSFPDGSLVVSTPLHHVVLKPGESTDLGALQQQPPSSAPQEAPPEATPAGLPAASTSPEVMQQQQQQGPPESQSPSRPASETPSQEHVRSQQQQQQQQQHQQAAGQRQDESNLMRLPQPTPAIRALPEFNHAVDFVNRIKTRFWDGDTYSKFLNILQWYQMERKTIQQVHEEVTELFKDAPDLLNDFKTFLPEKIDNSPGLLLGPAAGHQVVAGPPPPAPPQARMPNLPQSKPRPASQQQQQQPSKRKRDSDAEGFRGDGPNKPSKRPSNQQDPEASVTNGGAFQPTAARADNYPHQMPPDMSAYGYSDARFQPPEPTPVAGYYGSQPMPAMPPPLPPHPARTMASTEEMAFFDKVCRYIEDRNTYHEFLKTLNLYTQEIIDLPTMVSRASVFLGNAPELFSEFKNIVGWKDGAYYMSGKVQGDRWKIENVPVGTIDSVRPNLDDAPTSGQSYRQLPESARQASCSGRDALCWEVLNDEWVSQPTSASEEGFIPTRKNEYEAAMHRTEEERYEYDYHIEANLRTIALLDPIIARISQMAPSEREAFCLKPGLGGQSKSMYQGVLKKVYGVECGPQVVTALHDNPCVAAPIVMARLKQKDEEWKKALREWNRIWREVDRKNYYRALDPQGATIRMSDKKAVTSKALVSEIESIRRQQMQLRLARSRGAHRPEPPLSQLTYQLPEDALWFDAVRLIISFLDRSKAFDTAEKDDIEKYIRTVLGSVFAIPADTLDTYLTPPPERMPHADAGSDAGSDGGNSAAEEEAAPPPARRGGKKTKREIADLRRRTLQRTAANRGRKGGKGTGQTSQVSSREGTPDVEPSEGTPEPPTSVGSPEPSGAIEEMDLDVKDPVPATAGGLDGMQGVETVSAAGGGDTGASAPAAGDSADSSEPRLSSSTAADAADSPAQSTSHITQEVNGADAATTMPHQATLKEMSWSRPSYNFFCGTPHYTMLRLFEMVLFRLSKMKQAAENIALRDQGVHWSLDEDELETARAQPKTAQGAYHLYARLLMSVEQHWDSPTPNEVQLEDTIRKMFGVKGFWFYTIDRLILALCKSAAGAAADTRQNDIVKLLERDRSIPHALSVAQAGSYRQKVETILGAEENVYRVAWEPYGSRMHFQLLGKDEVLPIDEFVAQDRWQEYMTAYMAYDETPGIERALFRKPYLKRSVDESLALENRAGIRAYSGMGIHFCLRTLRKFFVKGGEDWFVRKPRQANVSATTKNRGPSKFRAWHQSKFDSLPARDPTPQPSPPHHTDAQTVPEVKREASTDEESRKQESTEEKASTSTAPAEPATSASVPTGGDGAGEAKSSDASASVTATSAGPAEPANSTAMEVDEPAGGNTEVKATEEGAQHVASDPATGTSAAAPSQAGPA